MADSVEIEGPFGPAAQILAFPTGDVVAAYRRKCGADIARWFEGIPELHLFECRATGYRFWRPASVAGDEAFYAYLSGIWPGYYHEDRWEYPLVRNVVPPSARVLEVGCGRGFFLRSLEDKIADGMGLELNTGAISNAVTRFPIVNETIEQSADRQPAAFDVVCSFQVLEHVTDPRSFIAGCLECLRPGRDIGFGNPKPWLGPCSPIAKTHSICRRIIWGISHRGLPEARRTDRLGHHRDSCGTTLFRTQRYGDIGNAGASRLSRRAAPGIKPDGLRLSLGGRAWQ